MSTALKIKTMGDRLDECEGIGPGFNTLRMWLSLLILVVHCVPLAHGATYFDFRVSIGYPLFLALLPMFFALSGFLVTGSAVRLKSTKRFLLNRGMRIFPALMVEVVLSALVLGSFVTVLPLFDYLSDPKTYTYLTNVVGIVNFELPGVFESNVFPRTVNGNLWTLVPEYYCYLLASVAMLTGIFSRKRIYVGIISVLGTIAILADLLTSIGYPFYALASPVLVFCFFVGSLFYFTSKYIYFHPAIFVGSCAVYFFTCTLPGFSYLSMVPLVYVTVFLGLSPLPILPFTAKGDYSYGIYLYGFPIQQTLVFYFPWLHHWWTLILPAMILTVAFSVFSWHVIEKPFLDLKGRIRLS